MKPLYSGHPYDKYVNDYRGLIISAGEFILQSLGIL